MQNHSRLYLFNSVLIFSSLACGMLDRLPKININDDSFAEVVSSNPFEKYVLYEDNFSDSNSGWSNSRDDTSFTGYENGSYRIQVTSSSFDVWVMAGTDLMDVSIQVEATKIDGTDNNDFGLICRAVDLNNFYAGVISSDGYYGLFQAYNGEELSLINQETMLESSAINQGNSTNILRLDCVGNSISLYVDGELIAEAISSNFSSGDIGLIVGTFDTPLADITFDNLVVTKP